MIWSVVFPSSCCFKAGVSVGVRYSNHPAAAAEADDAGPTSLQHCDLQPGLSQTRHEGSAGSSDYKPSVQPCRNPSKHHWGRNMPMSFKHRQITVVQQRERCSAVMNTFNTTNKSFCSIPLKLRWDKWCWGFGLILLRQTCDEGLKQQNKHWHYRKIWLLLRKVKSPTHIEVLRG